MGVVVQRRRENHFHKVLKMNNTSKSRTQTINRTEYTPRKYFPKGDLSCSNRRSDRQLAVKVLGGNMTRHLHAIGVAICLASKNGIPWHAVTKCNEWLPSEHLVHWLIYNRCQSWGSVHFWECDLLDIHGKREAGNLFHPDSRIYARTWTISKFDLCRLLSQLIVWIFIYLFLPHFFVLRWVPHVAWSYPRRNVGKLP